MLQITPQTRIFLSLKAVDFRKGIDSLAFLCRSYLNEDPFSGIMFVFKNRQATALKILFYDGQGYWLCQKRLSKGKLSWWPPAKNEGEKGMPLATYQLQWLLWNGDLREMKHPYQWKPLIAEKK